MVLSSVTMKMELLGWTVFSWR